MKIKNILAILTVGAIATFGTINVNAQTAAPASYAFIEGQQVPVQVGNGPAKMFMVIVDDEDTIRLVNPAKALKALKAQSAAPAPVVVQQQPVVAAAPAQVVAAPAPVVAAAPAPAPAPAQPSTGSKIASGVGGLVSSAGSGALANGTEAVIEGRVGANGKKIGFGKAAVAGAAGGAVGRVTTDTLGVVSKGLFQNGNIFNGQK